MIDAIWPRFGATLLGVISSMALLLMLFACGGNEMESVPPAPPWRTTDLVGYHYELVDPEVIVTYLFHSDGKVSATFGKKGGPVAPPLLYWHIDDKGILHFANRPGKSDYSMVKLEFEESKVTVRVKKLVSVYKRSKR